MNDPMTHYQVGAPHDPRMSQATLMNRSQSYTNTQSRKEAGKPNRSASYQDVRHEEQEEPHEFDMEWVTEEDVEAFAKALYYDPLKSPSVLSAGAESGTEQISAMNDFAPVRQKVMCRAVYVDTLSCLQND
jgi:hypothetical protein